METKRKSAKVVVSLLALAGLVVFSVMGHAGSLEPSAEPGPTMKTLDEVEPRTPISSLPHIISESGSYYLTSSLQTSSTFFSGITIWADNVTLDLTGFDLIGAGAGSVHGVFVEGAHRNIKVCNGTVRNWGGSGVEANTAINSQLEDLRVSDNGASGLRVGEGSTVKDCTARSNGSAGLSVGGGGTISKCSASGNVGTGILGLNSTIIACTAVSNVGDGITATTGSTIKDCTVSVNGSDGIKVDLKCFVLNNTCTGNGVNTSDSAGIHVTGSGNRIEGNNVTYNDHRGIDVDGVRNIIIRNTSGGHSNGDYDIVSGNAVGQIHDSVGQAIITTSNSWANHQI